MDIELWIFITTACVFSCFVGAIAGHVATRWGMARDVEVIAIRKDTAVEAAMDTAFELQRVSGEHDEIEVEPFMADSGYRRPCNNCGKPAVFAWETDGFPFAACNFCVSLWFDDGLPAHVERIDPPTYEPPTEAEKEEGRAWAARVRAEFDHDPAVFPRSLPDGRRR